MVIEWPLDLLMLGFIKHRLLCLLAGKGKYKPNRFRKSEYKPKRFFPCFVFFGSISQDGLGVAGYIAENESEQKTFRIP